MPALTVFTTNTNDTLVTTARQLTNSAPASETTVTITTVQKTTNLGWIELLSQGGAQSSWGASEPVASGNGWIWDVTTLEGQQILAGNWTPSIKLSCAQGFQVNMVCRAFVRSSGGVYTQIGGDMTLSSQTLTGAASVYTWAATSLPAQSFNAGDKLYIDFLLKSTLDPQLPGTTTINVSENGGANEEVVTPGYGVPAPIMESCYAFPFRGIRSAVAY